MKAGLFITLEGIEGVGKSTQMQFISSEIEDKGFRTLLTREPGGTKLGEAVRNILLNSADLSILPDTELLLMFAARSQHIEEVIKPALKLGTIVICDRFTDASYAYQGGGRGISQDSIKILEQWVQKELTPDVTFLFDADVKTGLTRVASRGDSDRFESEEVSFFNRVRQNYLDRAKADPDRIKLIDSEQDIAGVQNQILTILNTI
ncbi:MAG: dTMP kinase [Gammaproteobacteria bacterium]